MRKNTLPPFFLFVSSFFSWYEAGVAGYVWINGTCLPEEKALVPVMDRGFLYGDSVYETMRTYDKIPFLLSEHLHRLHTSAKGIAFEIIFSREEMERAIHETVERAGSGNCYVRLIVTRGDGEIGLDPALARNPRLIVIARDLKPIPQECYEKGISLSIVRVRRNPLESLSPALKTGNYLNSLLALAEAKRKGAFEAVMLNLKEEVTECANSNIFIVRHDTLLTPPLSVGILSGITRKFVLGIAREDGMQAEEKILFSQDLLDADEVFITSTLREVMPVREIDEKEIGRGKPGPITRMLMARYREKVEEEISRAR